MSFQTRIAGLKASLAFDNACQLIIARLLFRKTRFVPHRLNGVQFVADQHGGDECGIRPCLIGGMYDPFLEKLGAWKDSKPLNILDLGANAGGFSLIFASRSVPVEKLVSVEMNPLTYSRMRLNVLTAHGPRAIPVNAAVGGSSGTAYVPFTAGGTSERPRAFCDSESFTIASVTLDQVIGTYFEDSQVDILKMDIEGFEWDVLASENCNLLSNCRSVIVEIHPAPDKSIKDFFHLMKLKGFVPLDVRSTVDPDVWCFVRSSVGQNYRL